MPKSKSKVVPTVTHADLVEFGFQSSGDQGNYIYGLNESDVFTPDQARAIFLEQGRVSKREGAKRQPVRVPADVLATVRAISQFMSTNAEKRGQWGETEVSLKRVITAVIGAYAQKARIDGSVSAVDKRMVTNAVNALKRGGEIEGTKKGWFHAAPGADTDWTSFIA